MKTVSPYALEEYFSSGYEEFHNPFITKDSRKWGKHVALAGSIVAFLFLILAYATKNISFPLSSFFLVFVYFLAGTPSLIRTLEDIFVWNINIQVLMTLAALLSVLIGGELEGGLLLVLFSLSEALEESVTQKTKGALNALHKLSPMSAYVISSDGSLYPKSVREIELGTKILVKAGEIIPLDGKVIDGSSYINLSHLTGESIPVSKRIGDDVPAGALNMDGSLSIEVTKTSAESTLSKIIRLITEASESKPRLEKILARFSRQYATTIILLSLFFGLVLPIIFSEMPYIGTEGSIYRALAFLIAASPCALIIATPTAYLSAISVCAKKGILLKGGVVLDALAKCKILAFDKTGTLTTGNLTCLKTEMIGNDLSDEEAISVASGLERSAHHPIANAIIAYAKAKNIKQKELNDIKVISGKGVEGYINGNKALIGSSEFILSNLSSEHHKNEIAEKLSYSGHVVTLLLYKESVFIFHFSDEIRPHLKKTIGKLQEKLRVVMLTGDHTENANFVGEAIGLKEVFAGLSPEDKLHKIRDLSKIKPLMMIGDGINDGPALAQANVGIAMGQVGSSTAIEVADVVLLRDDLANIEWLYKKSIQTLSIVKQNVIFALLIILCATTLSLLGVIPLWLAVILHEGSTVLVGCNSLRLFLR
jgi:heavy metal translocating P-type ATPase